MEDDSANGLERTLGFTPAFMLGAGTMLGAGIFVFPGVAGGRAGGGAAISFAIGAAIALVVALCASELATRSSRSGGIINFAESAFGKYVAALLGLVQWAGLVFSIGFYLLGFAEYTASLCELWGGSVGEEFTLATAAGACAVLTAVSLRNTRAAGVIQKHLVSVLLVGIAAFIAVGLYAWGSGAPPSRQVEIAPRGVGSIFTTAALVFTSYLGFVQIANVAGDVVAPRRNLPRAMLGSVLVVGIVYILVMLITAATFSPDRLGGLGETALANVADARVGPTGRVAVLIAGMLATLSSANASILGTSRTLFALGQRAMAPAWLATLSRFGTPWIALLASSVPAVAVLLAGNLELLAEAASLLHLVIYAAVCAAALRERGRGEDTGGFRSPGFPVLPVAGVAVCLGLCAFFSTKAQVIAIPVFFGAGIGAWLLRRQTGRTASPSL